MAVFAGVVGNLLFSAGWTILGFTLFGGAIVALGGATIRSLIDQFTSTVGSGQLVDRAGGILGGIAIGAGVVGVVIMAVGFLLSGAILRGGRVRKPWGVTSSAILLSAVLSLPLAILYSVIAFRRDSSIGLFAVSVIGTLIVGALLWLWMTWARRGPVAEATPIEAAPPAPAVEAAVEPSAPPAPAKDQPAND
jgi:hypothetical protein